MSKVDGVMMTAQSTEPYDLAFLDHLGADASTVLSSEQQAILRRVRASLDGADAVQVSIGGKAGRLGEAIIGTAFVEGLLQTLQAVGKRHTPVIIAIPAPLGELLFAAECQTRYWPEITLTTASPTPDEASHRLLLLDFHGAHDGMPALTIASEAAGQQMVTLANLNRVALRSYAARGSEQRYAAFFRDLFSLPPESISGEAVQPRITLPEAETRRYPQLARAFGLDADTLLIVCFFQSVVAAKVYERWDETMAILSEHLYQRFPGRRINYLVACGPDTSQPVHCEDLAAILGGFRGSGENSRVVVATTPSLLDLAVITQHAMLALANDTGPGHLAGTLGIPTITPYLPGALYSMAVWASTPAHHGVTLEPNPYNFDQLQAAVFASRTDIINNIPPERLAEAALAVP